MFVTSLSATQTIAAGTLTETSAATVNVPSAARVTTGVAMVGAVGSVAAAPQATYVASVIVAYSAATQAAVEAAARMRTSSSPPFHRLAPWVPDAEPSARIWVGATTGLSVALFAEAPSTYSVAVVPA